MYLPKEKISVYVCTYKEENNIVECIKAIKIAGIDNIFVIDSSPDDLTEVEARKEKAEVIKTSKGLAGQRQVAIDNCKTEYMMFVDADDRLKEDCIQVLFKEMIELNYDALQASIRVLKPETYWQKGMDYNLQFCISKPGITNMVGRPAIYKTRILKEVGMDTSFNNVGNEDAALSIRMEKYGAKQGVGEGISYRYHPKTFIENKTAWKKYGFGDAQLIKKYPEKKINIIKHLLYTYPIKRSMYLIKNLKGLYIGFTIGIGLVRFAYMIIGLVKEKRY